MRIVVCDDDVLMCEMVESLVGVAGHELVGVAHDTPSGVGLVTTARPDAVVLDLSLGFNTDFDIIDAAISVGAHAVVFSRNADIEIIGRYPVAPTVVAKPDLEALEQVLRRLGHDPTTHEVTEQDRRVRPTREPDGPVPTGPSDAAAFFEAVNGAMEGDALVSIHLPAGGEYVANEVGAHLRDSDRVLLMLSGGVRVFLPGGGEEGVTSVLARIRELPVITSECHASSVVVRAGEAGADAFERLKQEGQGDPL